MERINIIGNVVTNEDVIRGELILDEGDPYTKLSLEKSISKIKSRNIFKTVEYEVKDGSKNNLKIINIKVEERPTGEIAAGAGVGTNGGSFAINIKESNWLGEGTAVGFDIDVDSESILGTLSYSNPNYNFGKFLSYSISSESNDKPDQLWKYSNLRKFRTSFEQYKDVIASPGISASYDDLRTDNTASNSLKKRF